MPPPFPTRRSSDIYNGILGEKRPDGGNVLTRATLALLRAAIARKHPRFARETPGYPLTVYGEQSRLTPATLARERVEFKQTPYHVKARAYGDEDRQRGGEGKSVSVQVVLGGRRVNKKKN